jgi:hypothetical protein
MTSEHRNTEPMRMGGIEVVAPSYDVRNGSAGNGAAGAEPPVISGTAVSGEEKAASDRAGEAESAVVDRSHVLPGVLESMRKQVGDFADFAHRSRIAPDSADALQALGCGGGVTAVAVEHMAAELFGKEVVAILGADQQTLTDSLLLSLVAPEDPEKLTERQRELFVSWRGRLALDVSMAEVGKKPVTKVVRKGDHPDRQLPAAGGQANNASAVDLMAPCAALIVGSAAYIADERPFLSLDRLMTYARGEVYRLGGPAGAPTTQAASLQSVRNLEVVLLLDRSLCGGLWIDVDRANGRPAAALAVGLSPKDGARFTHIPPLRVPELRTQAAGVATA